MRPRTDPRGYLLAVAGAFLLAAGVPADAGAKRLRGPTAKVRVPGPGDVTVAQGTILVRAGPGTKVPSRGRIRVKNARKLGDGVSVVGGVQEATRRSRQGRGRRAVAYRMLLAVIHADKTKAQAAGTDLADAGKSAGAGLSADDTSEAGSAEVVSEFQMGLHGGYKVPYWQRGSLEVIFGAIVGSRNDDPDSAAAICDGDEGAPSAFDIFPRISVRFALDGDLDAKPADALEQSLDAACDDLDLSEWFLDLIGAQPPASSPPGGQQPGGQQPGSQPFSCQATGTIVGGQLDVDGSCNGHFDAIEWRPLGGLTYGGAFTVEHTTGCPQVAATQITCDAKSEAQNPSHLLGGQFATSPAPTPGAQMEVQPYRSGQPIGGFTVLFQ